jgi:hypothetical protein
VIGVVAQLLDINTVVVREANENRRASHLLIS